MRFPCGIRCLLVSTFLFLGGFTFSSAVLASSPQLGFAELTRLSDLIVLGQVAEVRAERTPDGLIYTHARVQVQQRLGRAAAPASVEVTVPGGIVGDVGLLVSGSPGLVAGDEALFFLSEAGSAYAPIAPGEGIYFVRDGALVGSDQTVAGLQQAVLALEDGRPAEIPGGLESALALASTDSIRRDDFELSYLWQGHRWPPPDPMGEAFYVNENTADCTGEAAAIAVATGAWSGVSGADYSFLYGGTTGRVGAAQDGQNTISWQNTGPYPQPLAMAYTWYYVPDLTIFEADLVFNDSYKWSTAEVCPMDAFDVADVAAHELGHWAGLKDLADSAYSEATMYRYTVLAETKKRTLNEDDKTGLRVIYPATESALGSDIQAPGSWGRPDIWYPFVATYRDSNGWQNVKFADLLIAELPGAPKQLHARYDAAANRLYLCRPDGLMWLPLGGVAPGEARVIQNIYGRIDAGKTQVQGSGNTLTITWWLQVSFRLSGARQGLFAAMVDVQEKASGWENHGTWVVNRTPTMVPPEINMQSVSLGTKIWLDPRYRDVDGRETLTQMYCLITDSDPTSGAPIRNSIYLRYDHSTGRMYLRNDDDTLWTPLGGVAPKTTFRLENDRAIIYGPGSRVILSDWSTFRLVWVIQFKPAYAGRHRVYMRASDSLGAEFGGDTGWKWRGWLEIK